MAYWHTPTDRPCTILDLDLLAEFAFQNLGLAFEPDTQALLLDLDDEVPASRARGHRDGHIDVRKLLGPRVRKR